MTDQKDVVAAIMADGALRSVAWSSFFSRDEAKELMRAALTALEAGGYAILSEADLEARIEQASPSAREWERDNER